MHSDPPRPSCRFCDEPLDHVFADLGTSPLCESFVDPARAHEAEPFYPLVARVCGSCWLVQLEEFVSPEAIFTDYAYFSSFSESWLDHARRYVDMVVERFGLGPSSRVVELASNDGYLLQYFAPHAVPVLGIEPAKNVALEAEARGVPTLTEFFGRAVGARLRDEGRGADLVIGNNVLAQVPDLNDFVGGIRALLNPDGVVTLEFPHLVRLMEENQFDTIYHEHFSYFSLLTAERILGHHGLAVFDVDELPTHGGSLRVYARHAAAGGEAAPAVAALRDREKGFGIDDVAAYRRFQEGVSATKRELLSLLIDLKGDGASIVGYGAPGKGNTLLNYCGIRTDLLDYTVDRNHHKHGKLLPGTRIPIHPVDRIRETKPDYVLILPWNLEAEIRAQMGDIREWGGRFIIPIPRAVIR